MRMPLMLGLDGRVEGSAVAASASGLGSKVSMWQGPPQSQIWMGDLALPSAAGMAGFGGARRARKEADPRNRRRRVASPRDGSGGPAESLGHSVQIAERCPKSGEVAGLFMTGFGVGAVSPRFWVSG